MAQRPPPPERPLTNGGSRASEGHTGFFARISRGLTRDRLLRSFLTRVSGSAVSQTLLMAATPILTRLYAPADFGVQGAYTAFVAVLSVIACLGYQQAIPLPDDDGDAAHLLLLAGCAALGVSAAAALGVAVFAGPIAALIEAPALADYLWLLPVSVLVTSVLQLVYQVAVRRRALARLARCAVIQAAAGAAAQIGGSPLGPLGLIGGRLTGQAASLASILRLPADLLRAARGAIRRQELLRLGRRYWRFPAFGGAAGIVTKLTEHLPAVLFLTLFGAAAAGLYVMARRVCLAPMGLIGYSVSDVFGSRVRTAHRDGSLGTLVYRVYRLMAAVAVPPLAVVAAAGPELFGVVLGAQWRAAGEFARWITPFVLLQAIAGPLHYGFSVLDRQALFACYQAAALASLTAGLLAGAVLDDQRAAVAAGSLLAAACYFLLAWHLFRMARLTLRHALAPLAQQALIGALLALPAAAAAAASDRPGVTLAGAGVTGALIALRYAQVFRARRPEEESTPAQGG